MIHEYRIKTPLVKAEQFNHSEEQIKRYHIRVSEWKGKKYYWVPQGDYSETKISDGKWIVIDEENFDEEVPFVMSNAEFKRTYERVD